MVAADKGNTRQWSGTTGGSGWMHKALIAMFRVSPRIVMYGFVSVFVLPVCMVVNRKPVKYISHYFKARHGLKGFKLYSAVWRNHYKMMQAVLDRFAAYSGKRFKFETDGNEAFAKLENEPGGFIMLSSHIGNTELVGYSIGSGLKQMSALAFAGEAPSVMEQRKRMLEQHNIELILVGDSLDHIFAVNDALSRGNIVSMPADRLIGSQKSVETTFLGAPAKFPLGAFATAVQREVPLVAIFMMKTGIKTYKLIVRSIELTDDEKKGLPRRQLMSSLACKFASTLESVVQEYPEQWFNYYDFWNDMNQ